MVRSNLIAGDRQQSDSVWDELFDTTWVAGNKKTSPGRGLYLFAKKNILCELVNKLGQLRLLVSSLFPMNHVFLSQFVDHGRNFF